MEKEVGRCFCTEECVHEYFQPTVESLKEELLKLRSSGDFTEDDYAKLEHYQILTLEDPDEVWLDETETGERHFTFISYFRHGDEQFKYIVVCLTLGGDPSYVFLSFPTRDEDLVDHYRKGTDLKIQEELAGENILESMPESSFFPDNQNKLENALEDTTTLFEYLKQARNEEDIAVEDYPKFNMFIDPSLDEPDEIWMYEDLQKHKLCTFISTFQDDKIGTFEMVVVVRLKPGVVNAMEVVLAFPTIDALLVQKFKRGLNSLNKALGVGWASGRAA